MACSVNDMLAMADEMAELAMAKATGVELTYYHEGISRGTVYAIIAQGESSQKDEVQGLEAEVTRIVFRIANQTNFPPAVGKPYVEDYFTIADDDAEYYLTFSEKNAVARIWDCTCERRQPMQIS